MKRLLTLLTTIAGLLIFASAFAQDYVATPVTVSTEKVKLNGKIYLSHVVLERQTLFSIAKAYGVSEDEIYEANPRLRETGLQKNSILMIPYNEAPSGQAAGQAPAAQQPAYTEHVVKWYEDNIEDIARRYNVSAKELMEFNGLTSRKVSTRQVIKIPSKVVQPEPVPAVPLIPEDTPAENAAVVVESVQNDSLSTGAIFRPSEDVAPVPDSLMIGSRRLDEVDFSLVLPLRGGASDANMDFYSGVLMAMKDLEAEGIKVKLNVYDLSEGMPPIDKLCNGDFVLGPVASRDLEAIIQRVDGRVPVISPLDHKAAALGTRYSSFVHVPSATENQYEDLGEWVREDTMEGDKITLISEKGASNVTASVGIRSALARRELNYDIVNYSMGEGRRIPALLAESFTKEGVNRVVLASESEAFVSDVMLNLGILLGKGFNIVLYGPSKLRTFDSIDGSTYHQNELHLSTAYFADYGDSAVDRFVKAYRAVFNTEPSQFAFQGYDTSRYFVLRCVHYGRDWFSRLGAGRSSGLQTDFLFDTDDSGNHHNTAVRRIIYKKDYSTALQR